MAHQELPTMYKFVQYRFVYLVPEQFPMLFVHGKPRGPRWVEQDLNSGRLTLAFHETKTAHHRAVTRGRRVIFYGGLKCDFALLDPLVDMLRKRRGVDCVVSRSFYGSVKDGVDVVLDGFMTL